MKLLLLILGILVFTNPIFAWEGYDWKSGSYVEIEKGNKVRRGREIEIYEEGTYKNVEVDRVKEKYNGKTEVDVHDLNTGEERELEMKRKER